jgi:condensin complex subunit 1
VPGLDAAAALALAKCMAVDGAFCAAHLAPLFTRIASPPAGENGAGDWRGGTAAAAGSGGGGGGDEGGEDDGAGSGEAPAAAQPDAPATVAPTGPTPLSARVRGGLVVAAGDLAVRWPNAVEPWTAALYAPLDDPHPAVRRDATMVLSHLVLNDMVKVKGHAGRLAARLVDGDARVSALAGLFFHELARRASKGSHPVYNMVPDVLSSLCTGPCALPLPAFQGVMRGLLAHVSKDRQADALVDKLAGRMGPDAPARAARGAAFCLTQLNLSEKGVRRCGELLPTYRAWLGDGEVLACLKGVAARARKLPKAGPPFKAEVDAWEARMAEVAAELHGGGSGGDGGGAKAGDDGTQGEATTAAGDGKAAPPPPPPEGGGVVAAAVDAVRRMTLDGDDAPPSSCLLAGPSSTDGSC